jgi:ATP-binding cassette subfamily B protein
VLIHVLRTYLRPYTREVVVVVTLVLVQSIANLYLPNLNADIINNGVVKGDVPYIWRTGGLMLGITVVLGIIAVGAIYWASIASMGVGRDLRSAVFRRVQTFSAREINHLGTPSLITRNTNDVQQIQLFLQVALTMMVGAPIIAVGGVIMALREDVNLSALLIVVVPVLAAIVGFMLVQQSRCSAPCRSRSTRSTWSCGSRSWAYASSAPSSVTATSASVSRPPTRT